ncbi:MAG: family 16 glycoside hydrolase, partial [Acidobacteriota bacterium]
MKAAGKTIEVIDYPGQPHGFSTGKGTPEAAQKFFEDSHAFFTRHISTQPTPLDESLIDRVPAESEEKPNQLTTAEKEAGWKLLFDGNTTEGWRASGGDFFPDHRWTVEKGTLTRREGDERPRVDIITANQFDNFELYWEWRIPSDGNSGLKYFISEERKGPIGHEYQIVGAERQSESNKPLRQNAALYDLLPAQGVVLMPPGVFNESRLIVKGNHVEHWLNGVKVLEYQLGSDRLNSAIAASKFKAVEGFGTKFSTPI